MYYLLSNDAENYRNYIMNGYTADYANLFDGRSHKEIYKHTTFTMTKQTEKKYPISDFSGGYIPICSAKTKKLLEKICDANEVEFLPCRLEGTENQYYILNVLGLEDCVDYNKSQFKTFPSSNKIMFFEHIEFKKDVKKHIFRIKDLPYCHYFISEETKNLLENSNLQGLKFSNDLFISK